MTTQTEEETLAQPRGEIGSRGKQRVQEGGPAKRQRSGEHRLRRRPWLCLSGEIGSHGKQRVQEGGPAKRQRSGEGQGSGGRGRSLLAQSWCVKGPPFQFKGTPLSPCCSPWTLRFLPGLCLLRIQVSIRICILMLAESRSILSQFLWHQD